MTEAEMLKMIRRITGASQAAGKQEATQPDSVIAENYARVVAEVMRRDGIELNGVDMRDIRIRVLELLSYRRRVEMYRESEKKTYQWKKTGAAAYVIRTDIETKTNSILVQCKTTLNVVLRPESS